MANITKSASKTLTAPASSSAKYKLTAKFEETSVDTTNNKSTIKVTATLASDSGYSFSGGTEHTLKIYWYDNNDHDGGKSVKTTTVTSMSAGGSSTATGSITVPHKADGSLKGYAKAVWSKSGSNRYVPPSGNVSTAETAVTSIARTPVFTANPTITNTTETSITIDRGATNISSNFTYSISPNEGTLSTSGTTATYTGLSANTSYTITVTATNSANTSLSASKTVTETTWVWPSISSIAATALTPGNAQTIYLNNPHSRSITWYMRMNSSSSSTGVQVVTGTTTSSSITFTPDIDTLFDTTNGLGTTKTNINAFYYITYSGQTSSKTGTIAITEAAYKPTWGSVAANNAILYKDIDTTTVGITGSNQILVTSKSKIQYTKSSDYNATAVRSTISKYQMSLDGSNYTDVTAGTYIPSGGTIISASASEVKIYLRAIDARGYKSDALIRTISGNNLKAYTKPTGSITAQRQNNFSDTTIILNINPNWSVSSTGNKGTATYSYTEGAGGSYSTPISTTTFNSNIIITGSFDNSKTYTFRVQLIDKFGGSAGTSEYLYATVGVGTTIMFIDSETNSVGFNCFPREGSAIDVNGAAYFSKDGAIINGKRIFQKFDMNLSSYDNTIFYPIIFENTTDEIQCEIHSPTSSASATYNQNIISFELTASGWSDTPQTLNIKNYTVYSNSEITIGCIGLGSRGGYNCIWLRGGLNYNFYSNTKPTFYETSWSDGSGDNIETFTSGTNYYGGTNTNVSIIFTPQQTITNGAYSNRPIKASSFIGNSSSATTSYKLTAPGGSRPTSANLDHEYTSNRATKRLDLATSAMTTGKPNNDGWIETYFWDNTGAYDAQLFIPQTSDKRLSVRTRQNNSSWPTSWKELAYAEEIPTLPADTGWINVPLASGISDGGTIPQYKKVGNQVFLRGDYSGTKTAGTALNLGYLPEGFRPPDNVYILAVGNGARVGRVYITKDGAIGVDWIYLLTSSSEYSGKFSWLSFTLNYWVD